MRVLLTGAGGFIGKHVVVELGAKHELFVPSHEGLNLLDAQYCGILPMTRGINGRLYTGLDAIVQYLVDHQINAIVHLAATCGGIGINADNPGKFIYENLQMGINTLEGARVAAIKKVVLLGSVCAYPKHTPIPFQEDDIWNGYPEETNAPYGIAKKTVMEMGIAYSRQYDMDITNLIPVNMAGEHDNFDTYSSHVIPALIKKFEDPLLPLAANTELNPTDVDVPAKARLWGTGSASREFLYAGDCAKAIAIALGTDTGPQPINLGTGKEITIKELANMIKEIGGYDDVAIVWDESKPDGQPRRCLDVTRAQDVLGWQATTPLEEIIRRTISWYRTNV